MHCAPRPRDGEDFTQGVNEVSELGEYLRQIVEPTVEDFKRNPTSARHAYLACVATYHAIDRVAYPKSVGNLRKEWGKQSLAFAMVDLVAHQFKHVRSNDEKAPHPPRTIRLSPGLFGQVGFNTHAFNDTGSRHSLRNLLFLLQTAVKFLHDKARPAAKRNARSAPKAARPP